MTGRADDAPEMDEEGGAGGGPPPATVSFLVASIAAQVQVALGQRENPLTKRTKVDLPIARHGIDLLEVLEHKTKGNLDDAERRLLGAVLYDLRMAYARAAKA